MPKNPHVKRKYDLLCHRIKTGYFNVVVSAALSRPGNILYPTDPHEIVLTRKIDALTEELLRVQFELADYREAQQRYWNVVFAMKLWFK